MITPWAPGIWSSWERSPRGAPRAVKGPANSPGQAGSVSTVQIPEATGFFSASLLVRPLLPGHFSG